MFHYGVELAQRRARFGSRCYGLDRSLSPWIAYSSASHLGVLFPASSSIRVPLLDRSAAVRFPVAAHRATHPIASLQIVVAISQLYAVAHPILRRPAGCSFHPRTPARSVIAALALGWISIVSLTAAGVCVPGPL